MHRNCISIGEKTCDIGQPLMDLLLGNAVEDPGPLEDLPVDLIIQGHDQTYQRSKQLSCVTDDLFVAACVADDGSDDEYVKGMGTVLVINGAGGKDLYDINNSDSHGEELDARQEKIVNLNIL